jgi:hypothetical protein
MLRNLNSKDRFGLVSYGIAACINFPVSFMTLANKERALGKITQVKTQHCTNLSGGLSLASQELEMIDMGIVDPVGLTTIVQSLNKENDASSKTTKIESSMEGMEASVPTNRTSEDSFANAMANMARITKNKPPVSLFCFGYGTQHNSGTLRIMADASPGGAYYFVENDEDLSTAFGDALGGLLSVVAQSACIAQRVPTLRQIVRCRCR